jgi:uroporphyrinogen-III synthase
LKIKRILVSQPAPENDKSPFHELAEKNNLKIDFRPFIKIEGVNAKEFRQTRIDILDHQAIIFTSKTAIDHFFRICEELRITVPDTQKYFCVSESIALYLQKYTIYRKRKIFFGKSSLVDLEEQIMKHKDEKFLVPLPDIHKADISVTLDKWKIKYSKAILYRTVSGDLSDINIKDYDVLVFYSPAEIKSLNDNFADFTQGEVKIASFGTSTHKAVTDAGLRLDIQAPLPECPSMTMALEHYIKDFNKNTAKK